MSKVEETIREYAAAYAARDVERVMKRYAKDAVVTDPYYPEPLRGHDAIRQDLRDVFRAFPDLTFRVTEVFEKDDRTSASEFELKGTHSGPLATPMGEVPATGKRLDMVGFTLARLDDGGLIREEKRFYDTASVMRQLGLMPEPADATEMARH